MVSTTTVEECGLSVIELRKPYVIASLEDPEFKDMPKYLVTKQVLVPFTIGEYKDEVLCDVVPSKTRNFVLGRPWRHSRQAKYDHHNNTYSLSFENRQISIEAKEVHKYQLLKREVEKKIHVEKSEAKIIVEGYVIEEKQESKQKFEREVKGEEIESIFVATENVTIPTSEKEKEEIVEKEIESIFVATEIVIIPTNNVSFTSCTLESLFQREVCQENRNLTFERSKEKEVEMMKNCEKKYSDVIEEEKENIEIKEEKREKKNECDENEIYVRKIKEEFEKDDNFEKIEEKKFYMQREREYPKEKICSTNPLVIYAGSDLRTNPLEEGENDEIMSSLNMWKETYKNALKYFGGRYFEPKLKHIHMIRSIHELMCDLIILDQIINN
ncbi:hypothetical protein QL285_081122 [Trifolium repens]|nr:hypothetical protein QL285_081122 [Trifolium repens]